MNENWYCHIGGKTVGPFTDVDMLGMAQQGQLQREHLVCRGLQGQWAPAQSVVGLFPDSQHPSPVQPAAPVQPAVPVQPAAPAPARPALQVAKPLPSSHPAPPVRNPGDSAAGIQATPAAAPSAAGQPLPVAPARVTSATPAPAAPPAPVMAPAQAQVRMASSAVDPGGSTHIKHLRHRRQSRNSGIVITVITVGVAAVLLIIVTAISMNAGKKSTPEEGREVATVSNKGKTKGRVKSGRRSANARQSSQNVAHAVDAILKLTPMQVVESVENWRDTTVTPRVGNLQLQVKDVWLAGSGADQRLYVSIGLTNVDRRLDRTFTSWHSLRAKGESASALVVNGAGDVLTVLPASPARIEPAGQNEVVLSPGEQVSETLEFADPVDMSELKIVLPFTALGRSGQYGFVVAGDKVRRGDVPAAAAAANVAKSPAQPEAQPQAVNPAQAVPAQAANLVNGGGLKPAGKAAQAANAIKSSVGKMPDRAVFGPNAAKDMAKKNGDQPSDIDGLKKQINRGVEKALNNAGKK